MSPNTAKLRNVEALQQEIDRMEQVGPPDVSVQGLDRAIDVVSQELEAYEELNQYKFDPNIREQLLRRKDEAETLRDDMIVARTLINKEEEPFKRGSFSDVVLDLDIDGALLVIAEYGQKTAIFPDVLTTASQNGFSEPMFSNLHMKSSAQDKALRRKIASFRMDLELSIRAFSFKAIAGMGVFDGNRIEEKVAKRINENKLFLNSLCDDSLDLALTRKSGFEFDEAVRAVCVGYIVTQEDKYNALHDSFRQSISDHYGVDNMTEDDVTKDFLEPGRNGDILKNDSNLRIYRFFAINGNS